MSPDTAARSRAHLTVDADSALHLRISAPATAGADVPPRLLLRLRPPKGKPEQTTRVLGLDPGDGPGDWRTTVAPDPALAEGRWDPYLLTGADDHRERLLPGVRDLRALVQGRTPDTAPVPLAVRVPYVTTDGYLALRTWLRPAHAEVDRVQVDDTALTVHGRLFGAVLGTGAAAVLRLRGKDRRTVRETELRVEGTHTFAFSVGYRELSAAPGLWDVFVRPAADAPLVRAARLLDDVADRKRVFVYPATTLDARTARPYYTVDNDLAVEISEVSGG
ncbi:hypothetical protein AB0D49_40435 [Streptomyces sp. NPDC048290]|uniref:hypothetical protein n=1 Tax=Streptomyces sp. NPDC048290 TaxID=3155811 RepID=UPI0034120209